MANRSRPTSARQFTATWSVPANEATTVHVVKVGVFGAGWNGLAHWNDDAARITVTVSGGTSTTTTQPTTTTTAKPTTTTQRRRPRRPSRRRRLRRRRPRRPSRRRRRSRRRPRRRSRRRRLSDDDHRRRRRSHRPPPPTGHFSTLPPGAALPSDAACAAQVRPMAERRPINNVPNHTKGAAVSGLARVTGNFTGTTDEIIEWVACKWGIDEDIVRAQIAKESWWHQDAAGRPHERPERVLPDVPHRLRPVSGVDRSRPGALPVPHARLHQRLRRACHRRSTSTTRTRSGAAATRVSTRG